MDLALDASGNLYLAEDSRGLRKVDAGGLIRTVVGADMGFCGEGGPAPAACLTPWGITVDAAGRTYVADPLLLRVWRLTPPS